MSRQIAATKMADYRLYRFVVILGFLLSTLVITIDSTDSSQSETSATQRPRTLLHPFAKFRGQEVNYAPVTIVEAKEAKEDKVEPVRAQVEAATPSTSTKSVAAEPETPETKKTTPFKTTYSATKSDMPTVMPEIVSGKFSHGN